MSEETPKKPGEGDKKPEPPKPTKPLIPPKTPPTPPPAGQPGAKLTPPPTPGAPKPPAPGARPGPTPTAPKPATPGAAKPPVPPRPAPPRPAAGVKSQERRHFIFTWLGLAWTAFGLATAAALSTTLRFLFPNVLFEPKSSFKAGSPETYEIGKVDTRFENQYGVWLIRSLEGMYALSTICTHLGCKPSWLEGEQKFKCPCHGSGFYKSGVHFEGPAPRPLERYRIGLAEDGQVLVDKSKKFQQEKGEWTHAEAFLPL